MRAVGGTQRGQEEGGRERCIAILCFIFIPQTEGFNFQNCRITLSFFNFFCIQLKRLFKGTFNYFSLFFLRNVSAFFVPVGLLQNANIFSLSYTPTSSKIMLEQVMLSEWKFYFHTQSKWVILHLHEWCFPYFMKLEDSQFVQHFCRCRVFSHASSQHHLLQWFGCSPQVGHNLKHVSTQIGHTQR